jgi:excinuclease UvrABC ATPase subunit
LDDERWNSITDNLDLLFAKVGEIERNQQKSEVKFDMSTKVVEQMLKDQQLMAKQIENTGR